MLMKHNAFPLKLMKIDFRETQRKFFISVIIPDNIKTMFHGIATTTQIRKK